MLRNRLVQIIVVFCLSFLITYSGKAQDPQFSQFYANPLYLNPALAGATECARINLNYRNQWPSLTKAFITYSMTYDQNLSSINSGFGLIAMNDRQGDGARRVAVHQGSTGAGAGIEPGALGGQGRAQDTAAAQGCTATKNIH